MANSLDPDQARRFWVQTVCQDSQKTSLLDTSRKLAVAVAVIAVYCCTAGSRSSILLYCQQFGSKIFYAYNVLITLLDVK